MDLVAGYLVSSCLALGPVAPGPAAAPVVASQPQEFRGARVEVVGFDEAAVLSALRLRLPRLPIVRHGGAAPVEVPHVYVQIVRAADGAGELRVITSDGRAYERRFAVEIGQEVRVVASTAASLIFAVEEGQVAPDREDVAIPPSEPAPSEPAPDEPRPEGPAPEEPRPEEPRPEEPRPEAAPPGRTDPTGPNPQGPGDRSAAARRWELSPAAYGAALVSLPAQDAGPLAGAGGGLGLGLRAPGGALVALELRGLGRSEGGYGLGRLRVAVGAGYAWRRGRFELPVLLALSVEPWWARRAGDAAPIFSGAAEVGARPLLGGFVVVSPGLRVAPTRGPVAGVRVGPRLELGGSFVVDGGAHVVGLADPAGTSRFRLGGLELSLGLEVAVAFGLRGRGGGSATRSP